MPHTLEHLRAALGKPGRPSSDYDLNPETVLPEGRRLRPAGVLAPIIQKNGRFHLLMTKRASGLKHHPGQIAFPGGKQDAGDADVTAAALREAHEEIGLPPGQVEIFGTLPAHETVTGFIVTPVIGFVKDPFTMRPEPGEVEEVFAVPLDHALDADKFVIEGRRWRGTKRRYFAVPYGPYYIWGATARMLRSWTDQMSQ
ncbi:MAG: CoA pyrophosphatase [Roseobacter sp.]